MERKSRNPSEQEEGRCFYKYKDIHLTLHIIRTAAVRFVIIARDIHPIYNCSMVRYVMVTIVYRNQITCMGIHCIPFTLYT